MSASFHRCNSGAGFFMAQNVKGLQKDVIYLQ